MKPPRVDEAEVSSAPSAPRAPAARTSTRCRARCTCASTCMPRRCRPALKERLLAQADQRITEAGVIVIKAQDHRSQPMNRADALARLQAMVDAAAHVPRGAPRHEAELRLQTAAARRQGRARRGEGRSRTRARRVSALLPAAGPWAAARRAATMRRMATAKTIYTCRDCGGTSPKWLGKCPHCGAWNTLDEGVAEPAGAAASKNRFQSLAKRQPVATLSEIDAADVAAHAHRAGRTRPRARRRHRARRRGADRRRPRHRQEHAAAAGAGRAVAAR